MQSLNRSRQVSKDIKIDQLANFVKKVWGHEEWIVNNTKYCGKKLVVNSGYRCSMHKHDIKDETFYIMTGKILMETEFQGEKDKKIMEPGDIIHIATGMWHRFTAIFDSQIMEFSTFHKDEDSIRREPSGSIDLEKLSL